MPSLFDLFIYLFIKNNTSQYNEVVCWNIFCSESTTITRPNIISSKPFASEALEYCYTITNTLIIRILPNKESRKITRPNLIRFHIFLFRI